jgi:hypothetical protein
LPVHDFAQPLVVSIAVSPGDVAANHAALLLMAGVIGAIEVK